MGRSVNCEQFRTLITPAVDGRLEGVDRLAFDAHLQECPECKRHFDLEQAIKRRIRERIPHLPAPAELREHIMNGIRDLSRKEHARQPWWKRALSVGSIPGVKPVAMISLAAIAVFMFVTFQTIDPDESALMERNLVERSVLSYHALQSGAITPQIVSSNPMQVQGYLSQQTECTVEVPVLHDFILVGGLTNDFRGVRVAQILYRRGGTVLTMTQVPLDAVLRNNALSLPLKARNGLLHSGWYSDYHDDGDAVVLWTRGTTLCTAVAHMHRAELESVMISSDDSTGAISRW